MVFIIVIAIVIFFVWYKARRNSGKTTGADSEANADRGLVDNNIYTDTGGIVNPTETVSLEEKGDGVGKAGLEEMNENTDDNIDVSADDKDAMPGSADGKDAMPDIERKEANENIESPSVDGTQTTAPANGNETNAQTVDTQF